jgi:hypothetical protein
MVRAWGRLQGRLEGAQPSMVQATFPVCSQQKGSVSWGMNKGMSEGTTVGQSVNVEH